MRYRTRVVEVEAIQVKADNILAAARWCSGKIATVRAGDVLLPSVRVLGYYGAGAYAYPGDWIVRHGDGGYSIQKHSEFTEQFERHEESDAGHQGVQEGSEARREGDGRRSASAG